MDPIWAFVIGVIAGVLIACLFDNLFDAIAEDKQSHDPCVWIAPSDYEIKAMRLSNGTIVHGPLNESRHEED